MADEKTKAIDVDYNFILFADTNGLDSNTRYRLFLHHVNKTGISVQVSVKAVNNGTYANPELTWSPIWSGISANVQTAGQTAEWDFLNAIPSSISDILDPDSVPDGISQGTSIPPGIIASLQSFTVNEGEVVSAIVELTVSEPGICIYVVMEWPDAPKGYPIPLLCYEINNNTRTAALDGKHTCGTLPDRLVTRIAELASKTTTGLIWRTGGRRSEGEVCRLSQSQVSQNVY